MAAEEKVFFVFNQKLGQAGPIAERFKSSNNLEHGRGDPGSNPHESNVFFKDGELSENCIASFTHVIINNNEVTGLL